MAALSQTEAKPKAPVPTIKIQMAAGVARLDKPLGSKTAKAGDTVTASLTDVVTLSDGTVLPKESVLTGHVVAVQPSHDGSDSRLVLLFNKVILKGEPPYPVKVTIQGLRMPPIPGPDKTGMEGQVQASTTGALGNGGAGYTAPHPEGIKDTSVPGVSLESSIRDPNSGTITAKGQNSKLPLWTQLRIAIVHLPPNAVIN